MKRVITYLILIIILTSLGVIGYLNKPVYYPEEALDRTYYKYNNINDEYEDIIIKKTGITYNGTTINIDGCKTYTYNEDTGIIKMDCGKSFRIAYVTEKALVINIDTENYFFFTEKEETYNRETKNVETNTNEQLKDVKINSERLTELLNSEEQNYVYIKNENCTSNCTFVENSINTILTGKTVYYIESSELNEELVSLINNYNQNILMTEEAVIVELSNKQITNAYFIDAEGLSSLNGYLDDKVNKGEE